METGNYEAITALTGLTRDEQCELISLITNEWRRQSFYTKKEEWRACFNTFNGKFTTPLRKTQSWIQKARVFMPTMRTLVYSLSAAMYNYMMPNDRWLNIKQDEILDDFWTDVALTNLRETDWGDHTQESVVNAAITGDNYTVIRQKGVYFEVVPVALSDIVVCELMKDISKASKVIRFFERPFDLKKAALNGDVKYFNLEGLDGYPWQSQRIIKQQENANSNPIDRSFTDAQLGAGLPILEAHIYHHQFASGKEISNVVCSVVETPRRLIRFEEGESDLVNHTPWMVNPSGVYFGQGIIQPGISLINYSNTLLTAELVGQLMDAMGGYTYNIEDQVTRQRVKQGKIELGPLSLNGIGERGNLQPMQRVNRRPSGQEFFNLIKNELVEVSNSNAGVSGVNSPTGFAQSRELDQIQYGGANNRAQAVAKWWDKHHIAKNIFRILKLIQKQLFPEIDDGFGNVIPFPNKELLEWWMRKIGRDEAYIAQKLEDPRFLQALAYPLEFTQVEPTGTDTSIKEQRELESFTNSVAEIRPEESPFILWQEVARERFKRNGVKDFERFVKSDEQIALEQQQQAMQQGMDQNAVLDSVINAIESGTNPETGEPLSDEEMQEALAYYEQVTGEPYQGPQEEMLPQEQLPVEQQEGIAA